MSVDEEILKHQDRVSEYEQERCRGIRIRDETIIMHNRKIKGLEKLIEAEEEILAALCGDA